MSYHKVKNVTDRAWRILCDMVIIFWLACGLAAAVMMAHGQTTTNYVWPAAPSDPHDGSDWLHAHTNWTGSDVRGRITYLANGPLAANDFGVAESGTTRIWYRKATATDHGTDTGWFSTNGTGQFVIQGQNSLSRDYYTFDGSYRDDSSIPLSWTNGSAYGIRVVTQDNGGGNGKSWDIDPDNWPPGADHLALNCVAMGGTNGGTYPNAPGYAIRALGGRTDFSVTKCALMHTWVPYLGRDNSSNTFNSCAFAYGYSKEGISYETFTPHIGDGWIIQSNIFLNVGIEPNAEGPTAIIGVFQLSPGGVGSDHWLIQWNVFATDTAVSMQSLCCGTILMGDDAHVPPYGCTNTQVFNNALFNMPGDAAIHLTYAADSPTPTGNASYLTLASAINAVFGTSPAPPASSSVVRQGSTSSPITGWSRDMWNTRPPRQ